jgi:hypothetical protein
MLPSDEELYSAVTVGVTRGIVGSKFTGAAHCCSGIKGSIYTNIGVALSTDGVGRARGFIVVGSFNALRGAKGAKEEKVVR